MILNIKLDTYSCARAALNIVIGQCVGKTRDDLIAARDDLTDAFHAHLKYSADEVPALIKRQAG